MGDCRTKLDACKENQTELEQQGETLTFNLSACQERREQQKTELAQLQAKAGDSQIEMFNGEETKMAVFGGAGLFLGILFGGAIAAWCWYRNKVANMKEEEEEDDEGDENHDNDNMAEQDKNPYYE